MVAVVERETRMMNEEQKACQAAAGEGTGVVGDADFHALDSQTSTGVVI